MNCIGIGLKKLRVDFNSEFFYETKVFFTKFLFNFKAV